MNELKSHTLPKCPTGEDLDETTNGGLERVTQQLSTRRFPALAMLGNLNRQHAAAQAKQVVAVHTLIKEIPFTLRGLGACPTPSGSWWA